MAGDVRHTTSMMCEAHRLAAEGCGVMEIARSLGVGHATVGRWLDDERRKRDNAVNQTGARRRRGRKVEQAILRRAQTLAGLKLGARAIGKLLEVEFGGQWNRERVRTMLAEKRVPRKFKAPMRAGRFGCSRCGGPLPPYSGRGRPRYYCDDCSLKAA